MTLVNNMVQTVFWPYACEHVELRTMLSPDMAQTGLEKCDFNSAT